MKILAAVLLCTLLFACSTSRVMVGEKRQSISSDQVKIYLRSPDCPYEEVALLSASSRNSFAVGDQGKMNKAIARMKSEAAKLGANGVIVGGTGSETTGMITQPGTPGYGVALGHQTVSGAAIYVKPGCGK